MKFDDALTIHSGVVWDAESVRVCRGEISLEGCTLKPAAESRVAPIAGVALLPTLVFNQVGKLATIRLRTLLKGDIDRAQCERAHGQLSNHLRRMWGSPTASSSDKRGMPEQSTKKGQELLPGTGEGPVVGRETFHVQPDGRQIALLSSHIGATDSVPAVCHLSIYYQGPKSLQPPPEERPHPLKNWY